MYTDSQKNQVGLPAKYMKKRFLLLFCVMVASVAVSVLSNLIRLTWVSRLLEAGAIACLFWLAPASGRYRNAAIFRIVALFLTLISPLVLTPVIKHMLLIGRTVDYSIIGGISTAAMLLGQVFLALAVWQEYYGHSNVVQSKDAKLAKNWHILFVCTLALVVLSTIVSYLAIDLYQKGQLSADVVNGINTALQLLQRAIDIFYLWQLYRMLRLSESK